MQAKREVSIWLKQPYDIAKTVITSSKQSLKLNHYFYLVSLDLLNFADHFTMMRCSNYLRGVGFGIRPLTS